MVALCVGLMLLCVANVNAASISTSDGNGADSYIWVASPNSNHGSREIVAVKNDLGGLGNSRKGYLRFDLSSIAQPIANAALELVYAGTNEDEPLANPSTYSVYALTDQSAGENWQESTITWNNAPANDTNSGGGFLASDSTFLGSFTVDFSSTLIGDVVQFSSPGFVTFLNADTDNFATIMLSRQQENFSLESFASKEHETFAPPTLEYSVIPIPAAVWLFGSCVLALIGCGWRRQRI